jgi:hypothetical protein
MKSLSRIFIAVLFLLTSVSIYSQTNDQSIDDIVISDFSPVLSFLSSDWMEGRESEAKGGFMAADYIASMMELYQLVPYGDKLPVSGGKTEEKDSLKGIRGYFQDFEIVKYKTEQVSLKLISNEGDLQTSAKLIPGIDFDYEPVPAGMEIKSSMVFAGYGIVDPDIHYDDYKSLDVKGKVVIVLKGFPGHKDTFSAGWKKFGNKAGKYSDVYAKLNTAQKKGAVALIEIAADDSYNPLAKNPANASIAESAMDKTKQMESDYIDDFYYLPGDTSANTIPLLWLGKEASKSIFESTGIDLAEIEKKAAKDLLVESQQLKNKQTEISFSIEAKPYKIRNVLGLIPGLDTSKCIIIGAHYDHLGIRGNSIYNGADDNASGVSGMLALAKYWKKRNLIPPYNLIFASWTGEEKGLFGSSYFVQTIKENHPQVLLYVNLDMISRSSEIDTSCLELSIGMLKSEDKLRQMAIDNNQQLNTPFKLDLWEASQDGGSDYAPFVSHKISVMTFFSGYHDDYHTSRDTFSRADLNKMKSILILINSCLKDILKVE